MRSSRTTWCSTSESQVLPLLPSPNLSGLFVFSLQTEWVVPATSRGDEEKNIWGPMTVSGNEVSGHRTRSVCAMERLGPPWSRQSWWVGGGVSGTVTLWSMDTGGRALSDRGPEMWCEAGWSGGECGRSVGCCPCILHGLGRAQPQNGSLMIEGHMQADRNSIRMVFQARKKIFWYQLARISARRKTASGGGPWRGSGSVCSAILPSRQQERRGGVLACLPEHVNLVPPVVPALDRMGSQRPYRVVWSILGGLSHSPRDVAPLPTHPTPPGGAAVLSKTASYIMWPGRRQT
jgi:hypothetical protein